MVIYLLNAFPSSFLPNAGEKLTLQGVELEEAKALLVEEETGKLKDQVFSYVGHEKTCTLLQTLLGLKTSVPVNRGECKPQSGDVLVIFSFYLSQRLKEAERLTEDEILQLPTKWVVVRF